MNSKIKGKVSLDAARVIEIMAVHQETVRAEQIGFYPSLDALAEKVRSSRHWSEGETFVCGPADDQYVIMRQIAPASCEMMTVTQNGFHDVNTAYRYSQDELVRLLQEYVGQKSEHAAPATVNQATDEKLSKSSDSKGSSAVQDVVMKVTISDVHARLLTTLAEDVGISNNEMIERLVDAAAERKAFTKT